MLANLKRILERIVDNNRNSMPNDRGLMETPDGLRKSIEETIHYWKSARFKPPPKYMQNQNLIESFRYNGNHAFNPNIPPPQTLRQEDEYLNAFLSDDQRTSTKNARTLLKVIAQISAIKGRLEADREFFSASWPQGFEVDERNASMIAMKEAKEYFQDNKFGRDPVEYMDFVANFIGSTHNNRLLSVQEKSNVLRFACSEVVRKRCGLVHATTLGWYKEMIECIFNRYGSNLEYEDAYARKNTNAWSNQITRNKKLGWIGRNYETIQNGQWFRSQQTHYQLCKKIGAWWSVIWTTDHSELSHNSYQFIQVSCFEDVETVQRNVLSQWKINSTKA